MLEQNQFQFPTNWLHVDDVEGEWSAFNEIIKWKDAVMQTQVGRLELVLDSYMYTHTSGIVLISVSTDDAQLMSILLKAVT